MQPRVRAAARATARCASVPTGDADEVDVQPRGTITTFSVITPMQYQGQEEKEDYVQATILLDGSTRRSACSASPTSRSLTCTRGCASKRCGAARPSGSCRGGAAVATSALGEAISGWKPTGEPDAPIEQYADYIV